MAIDINGVSYLTTTEAAKKMKLSPPTIRKLIREGELEAKKHGNKNMIPLYAIKEYFNKKGLVKKSE